MTASEQRLAIGLGIVLIVGGAFVGLTKLKAWKLRVDSDALAIESRRAEADELLSQKEFWQQRSGWLKEKLPVFTKRGEVDSKFVDDLRSSASAQSVTLSQTQPTEPSERAGLTSSHVIIEARAGWQEMNQWLYELQKPESYIQIPALSMTPNEEDTSQVIVNMNVHKWFSLPPL